MKHQMSAVQYPELVFGVVGAVGTDLERVCDSLEKALKYVNYKCKSITLSTVLSQVEGLGLDLKYSTEYERITKLMDAGNKLREIMNNGNAVASLAILAIEDFRKKETGESNAPIPKQAYILKSLKHEEEVLQLRQVFGKCFWLISAYSPREFRLTTLAKKIANSNNESEFTNHRSEAEKLINRDEYEDDKKFGQKVRETFPLADCFIDASDLNQLDKGILRFIELIFTNTFHTPTKEEYGMFHAYASALRSASLSRQVGAAIAAVDNDIIATGTNEVPKTGGGLYGPDDEFDRRDFIVGYDANSRKKRELLGDVLNGLLKAKWLNKEKSEKEIRDLVNEALEEDTGILKDVQLMNLTEFGREVHAEMAALVDAARRTIGVKDCSLFTTTFPCHVCAKHIVAAGIRQVIYIEPYPKSLARELFEDSISLETDQKDKVRFKSFVGIAPRRYMDLFLMSKRKDVNGNKIKWEPSNAAPRYSEPPVHIAIELGVSEKLRSDMEKKNLSVKKK